VTTVAVLGAAGAVGRTVVSGLLAAGHRVVPLVREPDRHTEVLEAVDGEVAAAAGELAPARDADAADPPSVTAALDGAEVLVSVVGPARQLAAGVLDAAVDAEVHLVDVGAAPSYLRWVHDERATAVARRGLTVVPGSGIAPFVGDLLTAIAGAAVTDPDEVHVAYALPGGGHLGDATAGVRASLAAGVGHPLLARVDGVLVEELAGEQRRLAWFPRPVGPHHAAAIAGGEPITVPRHLPAVRTVRTYLAMPTWRAELAQFQASAARWDRVRRTLVGRLEQGRAEPSASRRAGLRWATVAEVQGQEGVARAWAYGHDPYVLTARVACEVVERIRTGRAPVGVLTPTQVGAPPELLDALAADTDLRWSVARPESARPDPAG
jgi:uncharacterized protein YbjT (DUF2867 family)